MDKRRRLGEYLQRLNSLSEVKESPPLPLMFLGMMSTSRHDMTSASGGKGRLRSASSSYQRSAPRTAVVGDDYKGTRQVIHVSSLTTLSNMVTSLCSRATIFSRLCSANFCFSEWDHVGIVVRRRNNRYLELLESTGDGVCCYPLKNRLRAYMEGYAHQIGIRRLKFPRTNETKKALSDFAMKVNGKPYALTLSKLISTKRKSSNKADASKKRTSGLRESVNTKAAKNGSTSRGRSTAEEDVKSSSDSSANYFCSELVADAMRAMGVLFTHYTASHYWPSSFAELGLIDEHLKESMDENKDCPAASLGSVVLVDCKVNEVGRALSVSSESSGEEDMGKQE